MLFCRSGQTKRLLHRGVTTFAEQCMLITRAAARDNWTKKRVLISPRRSTAYQTVVTNPSYERRRRVHRDAGSIKSESDDRNYG